MMRQDSCLWYINQTRGPVKFGECRCDGNHTQYDNKIFHHFNPLFVKRRNGETEKRIMDLMRYSCLYPERLELAEVYQLFLYYYT
ncbi:hypothetical protein ES705_50451 [subsurface metagenome]